MPKVTVDGVEIEVPRGATVLHVCELAGKETGASAMILVRCR